MMPGESHGERVSGQGERGRKEGGGDRPAFLFEKVMCRLDLS
jgi:hypothetical protein